MAVIPRQHLVGSFAGHLAPAHGLDRLTSRCSLAFCADSSRDVPEMTSIPERALT